MLNILLMITVIVLMYIIYANASDEHVLLIVLSTIISAWLLWRLGRGLPLSIILAAVVNLGTSIWGTVKHEIPAMTQHAVYPQSTCQNPISKPQSSHKEPVAPSQSHPTQSKKTFAESLVRTSEDESRERACIRREVDSIINQCKEMSRQKAAIGMHYLYTSFYTSHFLFQEYQFKQSYKEAVIDGVERELLALGFHNVSVRDEYTSIKVSFYW